MNTIDELWERLNVIPPLELTAPDIVDLIELHRRHRETAIPGARMKKDKGPDIEPPKLTEIGLVKAKPVLEFKRRL